MQSYESLLNIRAGSHLKGGTHQHSYLSSAHLCEEFFLFCIAVGIVDKFDLIGGDSLRYEFLANIIVHVEAAVALWSRKVAEYKLCGFLIRCMLPNLVDILHAGIDLTSIIVAKSRVDKSLIEGGFSPVVGDEEHIILG